MSITLFQHQAVKNKQERVDNYSPTTGRILTLMLTKNTPFRGYLLSPVETSLPIDLHEWAGFNRCHSICNSQYTDPILGEGGKQILGADGEPAFQKRVCQICPMHGEYDCDPKLVYPFLFLCLDLLGQKRPSKKNDRTFDVNPLVILDLPAGKGFDPSKFIDKLRNASTMGILHKKIWQFKHIANEGFQMPEGLLPEELGGEIPSELPKTITVNNTVIDLTKFMPPRDEKGVIVPQGTPVRDAYDRMCWELFLGAGWVSKEKGVQPRGNVDWDYLELKDPYKAAESKPKEESKEPAGAVSSSAKELNNNELSLPFGGDQN